MHSGLLTPPLIKGCLIFSLGYRAISIDSIQSCFGFTFQFIGMVEKVQTFSSHFPIASCSGRVGVYPRETTPLCAMQSI